MAAPDHERAIENALAALDVDDIERQFHEQGRFVHVPSFLPCALVDVMVAEARTLLPHVYRAHVPFVRKAGSVGQSTIAKKAPLLQAFYSSSSYRALASRLAQTPLSLRHPDDAHGASLYVYDEAGDHVANHYDDCGCESESSFTSTLGLVNQTTSVVHFQLFRDDPRPTVHRRVAMSPGALVFFCGTRAYHRVTPLRANERRIAFSFSYVREGHRSRGWRRVRENVSDAVFYFGIKALLQNNYRE